MGACCSFMTPDRKSSTLTSCGVAEEKACDIQTESIATTELGGCRILKISLQCGERDSLGG